MRIEPTGIRPPQIQPKSGSTNKTGETAAPTEGAQAFTPTEELTRLLATVRASVEIRTEAIESAMAKLAAGELETPEAAADTAKAMMEGCD